MFSRIYGSIDTPTENESVEGIYNSVGWFYTNEGIQKLEAVIDDEMSIPIYYGSNRPGLGNILKINHDNLGFSAYIDTARLRAGKHTLKIYATSNQSHLLAASRIFTLKEPPKCAKHGNHLIIACFPKSGSTYLFEALSQLTGYMKAPLVFEYGQNEQDLYLPNLLQIYTKNTISHQHIRATATNIRLMREFNIQPIILVRSIFDVVASYYDHLHKESIQVPTCFFDKNFFSLDSESKYSQIVDMVLPWYFSFYASWHSPETINDIRPLYLSYESMFTDPLNSLKQCLEYANLQCSESFISETLMQMGKKHTRFNIGKQGRGQEILSQRNLDKIYNYKIYYPWIDFSPIGL